MNQNRYEFWTRKTLRENAHQILMEWGQERFSLLKRIEKLKNKIRVRKPPNSLDLFKCVECGNTWNSATNIRLHQRIEELEKEVSEYKFAVMDHLGMVQKSGYDVNHFCPAMVKLFEKMKKEEEVENEENSNN